ncbi:GNAT family N-acetyltransferase [Sphingomonas sp.]|uniref:GNAT family N-acetyltransferase n=1 Tax=Sphingomonas sp. TaxID=28214 RepID=UPI0035BBDEFB
MIDTPRTTLRGWRDADIAPFDAMGRDPRVMAHFPALFRPGEAAAAVAGQQALQAITGYCFWAVERKRDLAFLGFCGVKPGPEETPIEGELEIGWRLGRNHWGQGYASEAAEATLAWVWANTPRRRVFAITVPANERSRTLMTRIGMTHVEDGDFDHPALSLGHPLRRHVLYRIDRPS